MTVAGPEIAATIRVKGLEEIQKSFAAMQASFERSAERMRKAGEKVGAGLDKSLKATTTTVRTTGTVGVRSFTMMRVAASGFISILRGSVSLLVRLGKAAVDVAGKIAVVGVGAFAAVQAFGLKTGQAIAELGRMAQAAGVPVERFSRLATATRLVGGTVEDLSSGLQTLSDKIIDAAKDAEGSAAASFKQLGVDVRDANGNIKSTETILGEIADGLAAVPSDTLRASAAFEIFGGSATKLLPILENGSAGMEKYASEADKLGTVVTAQQSKTARGLLVQYRKVGEALRGIAYRIADDLLPFLTKNSEAMATYLAGNSEKISKFVGKVLREISGISADLGRVLIGDADSVERQWVRKLIPAMTTAKNIFLDLLDVFTGGEATRAPWLKEVSKTLGEASKAAKSLGQAIITAAGFGETEMPTLEQAAIATRMAFESLRAGIDGRGKEAAMPWVASIGETMVNLGTIFGMVSGILIENREGITASASSITKGLSEAIIAVKALFNGELIPEDNQFAFLNEWKIYAEQKFDEIMIIVNQFATDVAAAWDYVSGAAAWIAGAMDVIAKAIGLENGTQLAIVILIAQFSGFFGILKSVFGVLSTFLFSVNGLISLFKSLGGMISWVFTTLLQPVVVAAAVALGLPVAAVWAIIAAIAALGLAVWFWWDEIVVACEWVWEKVKAGFDAMLKSISAVWESVRESAAAAWDSVVETWDAFTDWISGVFENAKTKLAEFWDWLTGAPGRAWDGLVSIWGRFGDFFSSMINGVKNMFANLWDGVKNGASDAWNSVKGWFGFSDDAEDGTADLSPRLRTGGIIRGAGSGTSDSIRAWLSNGEGVINARAVRHYGEGFIHALNALMLPQTHFATGGIVGDLVPAGTGRASGLSDLHLNLLGQRTNGGIYADADGMRGIKRDLRKVARASRGPAPRWRGY